MNKIWIASLFILCFSNSAQTQVASKDTQNSAAQVNFNSPYGPLPDPEIRFDVSRFPGYQTNVRMMRAAANAYRIQYIGLYRDEYVKTRGLPEKTKSFENTQVREVEFINKLPPEELFKITFPVKPERLKKIMDITAIDLESSLGFQAFKELHLVHAQLTALQKAFGEKGVNDLSKSNNETVKNAELEQLKAKVQEQEKLKMYLYVVGFLAILSLGINIVIYQKL